VSDRRSTDPRLGPIGEGRLDREKKVADYKVAYVSPCDSKRCPATRALVLLHQALAPYSPGDLTSIATGGDRTIFFEVYLHAFDVGDHKARVGVHCASGAVYYRATRRLVTKAACGVVFVPSLVEGYEAGSLESAAHLKEDLNLHGVQPHEIPLVLQWLPGDSRPEVSPESLVDGLDLPFLARFTTDRNTGRGIEAALFEVLEHARANIQESTQ
jgi:hypothetical protein